MKRVLLSLITAIGLIFTVTPAIAIENGEVAIGGPVVGLSFGGGYGSFCSGAMLEPRIVVTAHHCIPTAGYDPDFLSKWSITVSLPGIVLNNLVSDRANVLQIVTKPEFWTMGACANGFCDDLDDVALLIIDRDFPVSTNLKIASAEDLARFRLDRAPVITYGYGLTRYDKSSFTPMSLTAHLEEPNPGGWGEFTFNISVEGNQNVCSGDSGGPTYVVDGGLMYYLGPTSGTRRPSCLQVPMTSSGFYGGTALTYKIDLFYQAQKIAAEEMLKAKQAAEAKAVADKVAADLKAKEEAEAKAAADKAAAELKVKQEADAKAAAAAKAAALKKTTITCIKGKLTKKVTAVKPVCPAGYKKKA